MCLRKQFQVKLSLSLASYTYDSDVIFIFIGHVMGLNFGRRTHLNL